MKLSSSEEDGIQRYCSDANNLAPCIQTKFLLPHPFTSQFLLPHCMHSDMADCQVLGRKEQKPLAPSKETLMTRMI